MLLGAPIPPMTDVRLDAMLREFVHATHLRSEARTLGALLDELEVQYPRLRFKLRDETGALRRYVRVFVDGEVVGQDGMAAVSLVGARNVEILHSIAGG